MDTSPRVGNDAELFLATAESVRLEHRIRGYVVCREGKQEPGHRGHCHMSGLIGSTVLRRKW